MSAAILSLALIVPLVSRPDQPDRIVLRDGRSIDCRVLFESDAKVVYRADRQQRELARDEIADVVSVERSLSDFLRREAATDRTDLAASCALAREAEKAGLAGEARNLWLRVLLRDPSNARAWNAVGNGRSSRNPRIECDGEHYTIGELRDLGSDPKHPLALRTAHFALETDLPLARALDAALDLERTYSTYYALLGPHLDLYVFDEAPHVRLMHDASHEPSPPRPGDRAWFDALANTLYVQGLAY